MNETDSLSTLEQQVITVAEKHGWVIEDLNANTNGLRVKGQHWVARYMDSGNEYRAWSRGLLAIELAGWILRSYGEQQQKADA